MGPKLREHAPAARQSQEAGFTQPRAYLLADPCILKLHTLAVLHERGGMRRIGLSGISWAWESVCLGLIPLFLLLFSKVGYGSIKIYGPLLW